MLIRSQYGKGSNFMFNIIEFTGQYCYIPTGENCFIKCVNKIIADKILNMPKRGPAALQDALKLNLTYYDPSKPNNARASSEDILAKNKDSMMLCYYHDMERYCLVAKDLRNAKTGKIYKHRTEKGVLEIENLNHSGENSFVPRPSEKNQIVNSLIDCIKEIMLERYFSFLYRNSGGDVRKGVMTLSKISAFNSAYGMNIIHFNSTDRHCYPKSSVNFNNDKDVLYLYQNHFCLIYKGNKAVGIEELTKNFKKEWAHCIDDNVQETKEFVMKTERQEEDDTFVFDLETYTDDDGWFHPYACGIGRLKEINDVLGDLINSPQPADVLKKVLKKRRYSQVKHVS